MRSCHTDTIKVYDYPETGVTVQAIRVDTMQPIATLGVLGKSLQLLERYNMWGVEDPKKEIPFPLGATVLLVCDATSYAPMATMAVSYPSQETTTHGKEMLNGHGRKLIGVEYANLAEFGRLAIAQEHVARSRQVMKALANSGAGEILRHEPARSHIFMFMQPYLQTIVAEGVLPSLNTYDDGTILNRVSTDVQQLMKMYPLYFFNNDELVRALSGLCPQGPYNADSFLNLVKAARKSSMTNHSAALKELREMVFEHFDTLKVTVSDGPRLSSITTVQILADTSL